MPAGKNTSIEILSHLSYILEKQDGITAIVQLHNWKGHVVRVK